MSSARLDRLFGSTSFRLSLIFAALLLIAFVGAGAGVWVITRTTAENEIRERIQLEMNALDHEIALEGMPAAIAAIRGRTHIPGSLDYRLVDASGRVLIDDIGLASLPAGWKVINVRDGANGERERDHEDFLVLTAATPAGGLLSVGDDLERAERVRSAVLVALFWVGLVALLVTGAAGAILSRAALARMNRLSSTWARVSAGDLSARVATDVHKDDLGELARGFNAMLDQIARLVANVRRVSTDVAHDLRTPLAHLRLQLESASQAPTHEAASEAIRAAQSKVEDVLRLFEATLRLGEIEAGASRARFTRVNLAAVIERVTDAYRPDVEAQGRILSVHAPEMCDIDGDADLLSQALANLIENAMRYTPRGAPIDVQLDCAAGIALTVRDRGPGIAAENREKARAPFARLDAARSTPGAGLGLSIVDAIARLHGAELELDDAAPGLRATLLWRRVPH